MDLQIQSNLNVNPNRFVSVCVCVCVCGKWQADSKIYTEVARAKISQVPLMEAEQGGKSNSTEFQDFD